jgi:hypothetical protein
MRHYTDRSEISAYVEADGKAEIAATIQRTSGAFAEALAVYLIRLVNDTQSSSHVLQDAAAALEVGLEEGRLTFSSQQAIEAALKRGRNLPLMEPARA